MKKTLVLTAFALTLAIALYMLLRPEVSEASGGADPDKRHIYVFMENGFVLHYVAKNLEYPEVGLSPSAAILIKFQDYTGEEQRIYTGKNIVQISQRIKLFPGLTIIESENAPER